MTNRPTPFRAFRWRARNLAISVLAGPPPRTYGSLEELDAPLEDFAGETLVIRTAHLEAYLVSTTEDGDAFYVGIPHAEDEEGKEIDKNSGWVRDLPDYAWPVRVLNRYTVRELIYRGSRIRFARMRLPRGNRG